MNLVQFLAFIIAIPSIIRFLKSQFGPNWAERIEEINKAFEDLNDAKTDTEIIDAGKRLQSNLQQL